MKTISRITLFSLLSISLSHAMEEKNITPGKKGKHKRQASGEYQTFTRKEDMKKKEAEFRTNATKFLLNQTFHVLKTGNVPEYIDTQLTPGSYKKIKKPIESIQKAQSVACDRIDVYFLDKKNAAKKKDDNTRLQKILSNGRKVCGGFPTSETEIASNEFSAFVMMDNHNKFSEMKASVVKEFNKALLGSIQHRVAGYCLKSLAEQNKFLTKEMHTFKSSADEYKKEAEDRRREAAIYLRKANNYKYIGLPSSFTVGAVAGGAAITYTAYKAGYINTDKVAQDATNIINTAKEFLGNNS